MQYRVFGNTSLLVSEIGFGAWGIGGAAMAGEIPIGWGRTEDSVSKAALHAAFDRGINFYDTADFYGLGRSETLIGEVFGDRSDVVIATKVGHRLAAHGAIVLDYSKDYILEACARSLFRLRRNCIDFYQLHTAKVADLENGECVEAMEQLKQEGKIRYWGISINTFQPEPEAEWILRHKVGHGFQLVLNLLNQKARPLLEEIQKAGYGVIARMPLQFGLLTGKFDHSTRFGPNDHRSFRLPPHVLQETLHALEPVWPLTEKYGISKTSLALSFILSHSEVSTVIPGIKNPEQALDNTSGLVALSASDKSFLQELYDERFAPLIPFLQKEG